MSARSEETRFAGSRAPFFSERLGVWVKKLERKDIGRNSFAAFDVVTGRWSSKFLADLDIDWRPR